MTISAVLVLAVSLFTGVAIADQSTLQDLDGEGTEDDPYVITNLEELQAINEDLGAHYVLGNDIDASETETWNAGAGFEPIGEGDGSAFEGRFDGQGHTITALTIDRPSEDDVGLFGRSTGTIENVHLEDATVRGGERRVGALVGDHAGTIRHASATGSVEGDEWNVGGLVGYVSESGTLERAGADVDVTGGKSVGGLVGGISHWTDYTITESYATGSVEATISTAGGLVGGMIDGDSVRLAYSTADVTGPYAGGLVGSNGDFGYDGGSISTAFTAGDVSGDDRGPIVGTEREGTYADTVWDARATGLSDGFGFALSTAELAGPTAATNLDGFDFDTFWTLTDEYPVLEWQIEDVSVSLGETTVVEGRQTDATVTLTLNDGSTVTASTVADYETGGRATVDAGVVDAQRQGTTEITATVAGHSDTAELEITEPPNIELEDATLEASAAVPNSEVPVTATYANDGGPGAHTVELLADDEVVGTERIWVEADGEATVEFEWAPDGDAGTTHDVAVDDADLGSLTVVGVDAVSLESVSVPDRVGPETPYEVTAELVTVHDESVLTTVAYALEDERVATEAVTVDPDGSTATIAHETDVDPGLTVAHAVTVHDRTIENTSQITSPPTFEIGDVEALEEIESGEEFELTVTIENVGGVGGTRTITVSHGGDEVASEELALEADASETIAVSMTAGSSDRAEYAVETGDDETTVSVTVTEVAGGEQREGDDSDSDDGAPGFGPVAAVVALSVVAGLLRRRI